MPNFTLIGAMCRPCGAKNLKIAAGKKLTNSQLNLPHETKTQTE